MDVEEKGMDDLNEPDDLEEYSVFGQMEGCDEHAEEKRKDGLDLQ